MRASPLLLALLALPLSGQQALAQTQAPGQTQAPAQTPAQAHRPAHARAAGQPVSVGTFADWQAASHKEGDARVCYMFTRAEAPVARVPGRGDVVLTVTRREGNRDSVALSAGFVLTGHEDAVLQAGANRLLFYIAGRSAFSRDGAAAVAAFGREVSVAARVHGPKGVEIVDHFGLKGFSAAYAAMLKACAPGQAPASSPAPGPAAAP